MKNDKAICIDCGKVCSICRMYLVVMIGTIENIQIILMAMFVKPAGINDLSQYLI